MKVDRWIGENGRQFVAAILDDDGNKVRLTNEERVAVEKVAADLDRKGRPKLHLIDGGRA